jgi:hypothetical protein
MSGLPNSKTVPGYVLSTDERAKLRRFAAQRQLTGLANDTKWDELINAARAWKEWRPSYRFKCIDGPISEWDADWFYHLPFPMISVEWLDLSFLQSVTSNRFPSIVRNTDHSPVLIKLLSRI